MEQKLNRIEEMLATLIKMVGSMYEEQTSMKKDLTIIKKEQTAMREEQTSMKKDLTIVKEEQTAMKEEQRSTREELNLMRSENDKRHNEIITRYDTLEADHEHTWEKAVRNEREIAKIKKQFEL
ncbi:MAG: hypothetical protein ACQEWV_21155 [Bacillota bacterium]